MLAGFMRVLGAPLLERFPGRIINVHPALLPAFPGHNGPQDALAGGVRVSGCTVHVVDSGVDTGPIIAQAAVPVLGSDSAESLHARIQVQEHRLLPAVIHQIAIRGDHARPVHREHTGCRPLSIADRAGRIGPCRRASTTSSSWAPDWSHFSAQPCWRAKAFESSSSVKGCPSHSIAWRASRSSRTD